MLTAACHGPRSTRNRVWFTTFTGHDPESGSPIDRGLVSQRENARRPAL